MAAVLKQGARQVLWEIRKIEDPAAPLGDIAKTDKGMPVPVQLGQNTLLALADYMKDFCSDFKNPKDVAIDIVSNVYSKYVLFTSVFINGKQYWEPAAFMLIETPKDQSYYLDLHHICSAPHLRGYGFGKPLLKLYETESRAFSSVLPYIIIEAINKPVARDFYVRNDYKFTLFEHEDSLNHPNPPGIVYMIKFFQQQPGQPGIIAQAKMTSGAPLRRGYIAADGELIETTL